MQRRTFVAALTLLTALNLATPGSAQLQRGPVIACATRRAAKGNQPVILDLNIMNADGTNRKTLWSIQGNIDSINNPVWSPDLDLATPGYQGRIAFESSVRAAQLCTIALEIDDTGAIKYVGSAEVITVPTDLSLSWGPPAWSPDGRWIVFRAYNSTEGGMYAIPAPGFASSGPYAPTLIRVASSVGGMGVCVSWDPTSTSITYSKAGNVVKQQVVQPAASLSTEVPTLIPTEVGYPPTPLVTNVANNYDGPTWSGNGLLAFGHDVTSGNKTVSYLYAVSADTPTVDVANLSPVTGTSGAGYPAWSPGGNYLLYTNGRGIVRRDMATGAQILFGASADCWPSWRQ